MNNQTANFKEHIVWWLSSLSFVDFFATPVQYKELGLLDYPNIVKNPMDISTIIENTHLTDDEVVSCIRLIWSNALLYNAPGSDMHIVASNLSALFEQKMSKCSSDKFKEHVKEYSRLCNVYGPILNSLCHYESERDSHLTKLFVAPIKFIDLGIDEISYKFQIPKVICLGDVIKALYDGFYMTCSDIEFDIELVFDNAILFNGASSTIGQYAQMMKNRAIDLFTSCRDDIDKKYIISNRMRLGLSESLSRSSAPKNLQIMNLLKNEYPLAISEFNDVSTIDIDSMNHTIFFKVFAMLT